MTVNQILSSKGKEVYSVLSTNTVFEALIIMIKTTNIVPSSCYTDNLLTVNDFINSNDIIVYPNPTIESISINSNKNPIYVVSVYSIDGKYIKSYKNPMTSDNFTFNVQDLAVGLYTIKVDTNYGSFTKKIIVRR